MTIGHAKFQKVQLRARPNLDNARPNLVQLRDGSWVELVHFTRLDVWVEDIPPGCHACSYDRVSWLIVRP